MAPSILTITLMIAAVVALGTTMSMLMFNRSTHVVFSQTILSSHDETISTLSLKMPHINNENCYIRMISPLSKKRSGIGICIL